MEVVLAVCGLLFSLRFSGPQSRTTRKWTFGKDEEMSSQLDVAGIRTNVARQGALLAELGSRLDAFETAQRERQIL